MSQRIAFTVATALTVFVIITGVALVTSLMPSEATGMGSQDMAGAGSLVDPMALPVNESSAKPREELYNQRLNEANALLTKLRSRVETFKQREELYQRRLEDANRELANSVDPATIERQEESYRQQIADAQTLLTRANDQLSRSTVESQKMQQENLAFYDGLEAYQRQEVQYRQRLTEAGDLLQQAYDQIGQLKDQNGLLLQREQVYQQQLANSITAPSNQTVAQTSTSHYEDEEYEHEYSEHHDD